MQNINDTDMLQEMYDYYKFREKELITEIELAKKDFKNPSNNHQYFQVAYVLKNNKLKVI